jgi:undecaprenyl-diphosphatase
MIGKHLESLRLMATSLLVGGIIMWVVDAWSVRRESTTRDVEHMTLGQSIWIGLCQVASAVFPGTSRSMSTIAAGQIVSMTRSTALEFSFLVSIPTMIAATGYDLLRTLHPNHTDIAEAIAPLVMTGHGWAVLFIGFAVSFVVALVVVEWFLMWVRRHGFVLFGVYRIVVAALLFTFGKHFMGF